MKSLDQNDNHNEIWSLRNGYPILNEASYASVCNYRNSFDSSQIYIDDYYGRFFEGDFLNEVQAPYGNQNLNYYNHGGIFRLPIVGELRVPYRRIPIYKPSSLDEITDAVLSIAENNPSFRILLRGQNDIYFIPRDQEEQEFLYGGKVDEPSFLPSFSRKELDEVKTINAWHNFASLLIEQASGCGIAYPSLFQETELFNLFALGIAQHYGLPSVGLDLTDNVNVALWFAMHDVTYSSAEPVKATLTTQNDNSMIYVFRCSPLSIFAYKNLNVNLGAERPIRQSAYFNHCGWGLAKNQLALDLAAAFKVDECFAQFLPSQYIHHLFPSKDEDLLLRTALEIRNRFSDTEFGNLLSHIYI
jgi:hypothetical protein